MSPVALSLSQLLALCQAWRECCTSEPPQGAALQNVRTSDVMTIGSKVLDATAVQQSTLAAFSQVGKNGVGLGVDCTSRDSILVKDLTNAWKPIGHA